MVTVHKLRGNSHADVAQLVEHHLAKVRVAGSNPVVRSQRAAAAGLMVEWPRGEAAACKAAYTGSNPVSTSLTTEGLNEGPQGRLAQGLARFLDTEEVTGSIPVSPTTSRSWRTAGEDLPPNRHLSTARATNSYGRRLIIRGPSLIRGVGG